ncbi:hypothetical protein EK904_002033, partial [Melospiza melodia maxima]
PWTPRDAGAGLWEQQHPPDELHLYSIGTTRSYSPLKWTHFGWYYGKPATIWCLGILLHQMLCGEHPFSRGQNISWDHQLLLPQGLLSRWILISGHRGNPSAGRQQWAQCQDLIRWCLSMLDLERPSLEEL